MKTDYSMAYFVTVMALVVMVFIAVIVLIAQKKTVEWEAFKVAHSCKVVSHKEGEMYPITTVGANGMISTSMAMTGSIDGWLCDDGVTYFR